MSEPKQTAESTGNNPYIFYEDSTTDYPAINPADPSDIRMVEGYYSDLRARILAEVRHDETALNIGRVARFLDHYGIPMHEFIAVYTEDVPALERLVGGSEDAEAATVGGYFSIMDLSYVVRNKKDEAVNGPEVTEASLAHELSHASSTIKSVGLARSQSGEMGSLLLRTGFRVDDETDDGIGAFFEEGFAGLMENRYITEELAMPNGFSQGSEPQRINVGDMTYKQPRSYFVDSSPDGRFGSSSPASHAAYGMELLIAKDPTILEVMLKARTDIQGLRQFAKRVNDLSPGLYRALARRPYTSVNFMAATNHIIDKLYDGNQDKAIETFSDSSPLVFTK